MRKLLLSLIALLAAPFAHATGQCFLSGVTDQYTYFVAVDSTDFTTRETGLSSFTVYRSRNGGTATAMTTPTVTEVDATNMPGVYKLLLDEDMTIGTGNIFEEMVFQITATGMAPVTKGICIIDLADSTDNQNDIQAVVDTNKLQCLAASACTDTDVTDNSLLAQMVSKNATADWSSFNNTTDSKEAVADAVAANNSGIGSVQSDLTALSGEVGSAGDGLTSLVDLIFDEPTSGHSTAGTAGKALTDILDDTGTSGVIVATNNDKTGYSLSQSFPTNFADLSISASTGRVDVGSVAGTAQTAGDLAAKLDFMMGTFLNCEVNTANFAGNTTHFACILTDLSGSPVTQATGDLEGLQIVVTSGAQIREQRFINSTTWDAGNSELQVQISRALPASLADAVTVIIR